MVQKRPWSHSSQANVFVSKLMWDSPSQLSCLNFQICCVATLDTETLLIGFSSTADERIAISFWLLWSSKGRKSNTKSTIHQAQSFQKKKKRYSQEKFSVELSGAAVLSNISPKLEPKKKSTLSFFIPLLPASHARSLSLFIGSCTQYFEEKNSHESCCMKESSGIPCKLWGIFCMGLRFSDDSLAGASGRRALRSEDRFPLPFNKKCSSIKKKISLPWERNPVAPSRVAAEASR